MHQLSLSLHWLLPTNQWGLAECTDPDSAPPHCRRITTRQPGPSSAFSAREAGIEGTTAPSNPNWPSSLYSRPTSSPGISTLILLPGGGRGAPLRGMGPFLPSLFFSLSVPALTYIFPPWQLYFFCAMTPKLSSPAWPSLNQCQTLGCYSLLVIQSTHNGAHDLPSGSSSHLPLVPTGRSPQSPPSSCS